MTLFDAITARKSIRAYSMEPLEGGLIDELADFLSEQTPPFGDIEWNFDILPFEDMCVLVGGRPKLEAPHYLVLRSEKIKNCLQNCGYLGELAVLWLTARGIATCWQGGLKPSSDFSDCLPFVTAFAFGRSSELFRASPAEFKRKKLTAVSVGDLKGLNGRLLDAAMLAPSAMGFQPCRYISNENRIHMYRKKSGLNIGDLTYNQCVDVGVAMAHIYVAAQNEGYAIMVEKQVPEPKWRKFIYQCTLCVGKIESLS